MTDDPDFQPSAIACSSDATSVYMVYAYGSIFSWQEARAQLNMILSPEGLVVSWPSYHLSTRLQENSALNASGWTDPNEEPTLTNRIFRIKVQTPKDKDFYRLKTP
jgi:hypothetical protein